MKLVFPPQPLPRAGGEFQGRAGGQARGARSRDIRSGMTRAHAHLLRATKELRLGASEKLRGRRKAIVATEDIRAGADALAAFGDENQPLPERFWAALGWAYYELGLPDRELMCRFRAHESVNGFVEARVELVPPEQDGRRWGVRRTTGRPGASAIVPMMASP